MPNVTRGMKVVGVHGRNIGRVKAVADNHFILNRPKSPDLAVPMDACMRVEGDVVWLRVKSTEVHRQGWDVAGTGAPRFARGVSA